MILSGGPNCHVKLDQSSKYPIIRPGRTLHTYSGRTGQIKPVHSELKWPYMDMGHTFCFLKKPIHSGLIFWTYGTDKTYSFWTEMTIYGHGTHILFLLKPVHSGLKWPYMNMGHTKPLLGSGFHRFKNIHEFKSPWGEKRKSYCGSATSLSSITTIH